MQKSYFKKMIAGCCLAIFLTLLTFTAFAQKRVTGTVKDNETNTGLPGVSILVKGTTRGTVTDADGKYTIEASEGATLVFSSVGYVTQEIAVGSSNVIDIILVADVKTLGEIIVTGYGSQSKRDVTGAVATIDSKQLLSVPAANVAQAMQGRIAGVNVSNDNSPGGGVMVRVRGFGTIGDNSPLYVIDGVPTKGNLNTLNLNDIENMQVLKDASAASIYGARAGNGVVIITTKKGKAGKPKFTYDMYYGSQSPWKFLDLITNSQDYANLVWKSRINAGQVAPNGFPRHAQFGNGPTPVLPDYLFPAGAMEGDPRVARDANGNYINYNNNPNTAPASRFLITKTNKQGTDWQREIFSSAPIQNHQIGVSGGNEMARYAMSVNYFDQQGIMKYTSYKRYSIRANTEFNVTKRFRVGENFQFAYGERIGQPNGNNNESNPINFAYRIQPIIPVYDVAGYFAGTSGADLDNSRNPLAELVRNKDNKNIELRFFGSAYAEYDILPNLTFKTQYGVDYNTFNLRNFRANDIESSEQALVNTLRTTNSYDFSWTWYNTLNYTKTFADVHRVSVIAGTEAIKAYGESFFGQRQRFAVDDLVNRYLDNGSSGQINGGGVTADWRLASEFAKANYSFKDKYLVDFTIRRDRSSRFSASNRSALFTAASAGWRITEEDFAKGISWLNDAKLRAGYGQTGNQEIGDYNFATIFNSVIESSYYDLRGSRTSSLQGYDLGQFGNANAKWETTTSINFGFDATVFKNLDVSFDWFQRRTTDMLFPVEVQFTQGVAVNPFQNIGQMTNKGVELSLNYSGNIGDDFQFNVGGNFATYRNMVDKTTGDPRTQYFGFTTRLPPATVTQQGYPLSSFFGYIIDGIFQTDEEASRHAVQFGGGVNNKAGQFRFRDVNGDGVINAADRTIIGSPHPKFTYGLNIDMRYKNFGLTIFGAGVSGNQIFNYTRYWTDFPTFGGNRSLRMLNQSWEPGKTDALLPQLRSNDNISSNPSTYYIEKGGFLRLRNIQFSYSLPKVLLEKVNIANFTAYIQLQNWFTFTKYTGLDPEINLRNSSANFQDRQIGIDEGAYPASRSILVGVNLSF
ncbi:SusC/RagA family TonB-linked outer membrane protein [Thermoflexibacter ruber]|uniref:TonB-linked outer membrane protein, SusC/RagA family n=1 Tax=Thermoflexibacter ruber TaxID=1003 RepID=A0A1I2B8G5_9BACT|nr:TonB-dependent receptor [Thermoflexibacter ruber]SFE51603.1 TonB-linked outer membrane protein, SusC/RagA family [Thermoflexibacter ruber]